MKAGWKVVNGIVLTDCDCIFVSNIKRTNIVANSSGVFEVSSKRNYHIGVWKLVSLRKDAN